MKFEKVAISYFRITCHILYYDDVENKFKSWK